VSNDRDIVAAVSDWAVTDDSDEEYEICACQVESERPIVRTKEALRALKVITRYYDAPGSDDNLDVNVFCIEKQLQRRVSSYTKQTNITGFLS
jgi:hypothetical protein